MIFCWRHSFYCSKRKTKFHKVETGRQTFAESVGKHTLNSKLKPQGRDGDSTDGLISVRPPRNGPWIQLPTSGLQGAWIFSGTRSCTLECCAMFSILFVCGWFWAQAHSWATRVEAIEQKQSLQAWLPMFSQSPCKCWPTCPNAAQLFLQCWCIRAFKFARIFAKHAS